MATSLFVDPIAFQTADGAALTNTTTATSITHATGLVQLVPNFFYVGRILRITAKGRISTVVTTPGTLTLQLRFAAINVVDSGAMSLNIVSKVNVGWHLEWTTQCRAVGATTTANLLSQGMWRSEAVIGSPLPTAGGAGVHCLPYNTAPVVGAGFDSSAAQTPNLFATWSVANAGNSIQMHQFMIEALN